MNGFLNERARPLLAVTLVALLGLVSGGCASVSPPMPVAAEGASIAGSDAGTSTTSPASGLERESQVASDTTVAASPGESPAIVAQKPKAAGEAGGETDEQQYDPWEPFNEKMFAFNIKLDRWVLKPAAKAYNTVIPDEIQVAISNGFDNIKFVPRTVNSLLQGKWAGAGREVARFVVNSTIGFGGIFDPARDHLGLRKSNEDFGQTLGVWGAGPGPYLVLPFLDPMTVRDGIGRAVDGAMDPLSYLIPFIPERLLMQVESTVNDRSLNLELFQGVEETTIDLYSAVRHFYLTRREQMIKE